MCLCADGRDAFKVLQYFYLESHDLSQILSPEIFCCQRVVYVVCSGER